MLTLLVSQKKSYIPFPFVPSHCKTELRTFLTIFRGEGKGLFPSFKWHSSNLEKQKSFFHNEKQYHHLLAGDTNGIARFLVLQG